MLKKIIFYIATVGWIASFIMHLLTFIGYDIFERTSLFWMFPLHFMVFIVFIPAIIYLIRSKEYQPLNPFFTLKAIYKRVPVWASIICGICLIYVVVIFLATRSFPEEEGTVTRIFSSFWMLFYGVAAAILFPSKKHEETDV